MRRDTFSTLPYHALRLWSLGASRFSEIGVQCWDPVLSSTVRITMAVVLVVILKKCRECDAPGHGHDTSVDIWAIGMLTMQLVLGNRQFPDLEFGTFKSQGHVDNYLSMIFSELGPRELISNAGQSFICGCLVYDSEKRPTARQAFSHSWLQRPSSDRELFKRLEADNAASWAPQKVKFPVIETLGSDGDHGQQGHMPVSEVGGAFSRYFTSPELGNVDTGRSTPK